MDKSVLLVDATHKLTQAGGVVAAAPAGASAGVDLAIWRNGSFANRRAAIRLTGSGALNLTGIALWTYFDGAWSRMVSAVIADVAFVAGALSVVVFVSEVYGDRLAVTGTPSAGTAAAEFYTLETVTL